MKDLRASSFHPWTRREVHPRVLPDEPHLLRRARPPGAFLERLPHDEFVRL